MKILSALEEDVLARAMALGPKKHAPGLSNSELSEKDLRAAKRLVKKSMLQESGEGFVPTDDGANRAKQIY